MLKSKQNQAFFLTCASPPMLLCSGHTKLILLHVPYVFRALPLHILVQQLGMDFLPFSNGRTQLCLRTLWSLSWLPPSPQRDVVPSLCAQERKQKLKSSVSKEWSQDSNPGPPSSKVHVVWHCFPQEWMVGDEDGWCTEHLVFYSCLYEICAHR